MDVYNKRLTSNMSHHIVILLFATYEVSYYLILFKFIHRELRFQVENYDRGLNSLEFE